MSKSTIRVLTLSVIMLLVSTLSFGVITYYVSNQGEKLSKQIADIEREQVQENEFYRLERIHEETTEKRSILQSHFLSRESDSIDFLNDIEELAPELGVTLVTDDLNTIERRQDQSKWIRASFTFSGTREKVENFIKILENLPYMLRITSVTMNARSATDWEANVTLQVRVLDYDT